MTIWLLALLLVASVAALGYRQGAIKVAFSTAGIVVGALLAVPLGNVIKPILIALGVKDPLAVYLVAPAIIFVLFSIIFKVAATSMHHKADVYYKYQAGDLRLALWERLNRRLGLGLGLLNGVLYMILISFAIYSLSYPTFQLASEQGDPTWMRLLNRFGQDLRSSGFDKVARAMDKRTIWYDASDLAGVLYRNPLLEARLARYPAFLGLAERQEFKALGNDKDFAEMRSRREPLLGIINYDKVQNILKNADLVKTIWSTLLPDMKDLSAYLQSGKSAKYDAEPILGRWTFDVTQTMVTVRRARPNMSSKDAQAMKKWLATVFANTSMVAMPDHQIVLKELPQTRVMNAPATAPSGTQTATGQWKAPGGGAYELNLSGLGTATATVDGDRLKMVIEGTDLAFTREI